MKNTAKKLLGSAVSPGIAIGKALLYQGSDPGEIAPHRIQTDQLDAELRRFKGACHEAAQEIRDLQAQVEQEGSKESQEILSAHLMMIEDVDFHDQVEGRLKETEQNIEWVVYDISHSLMQTILASPDPAFRERASDILDVSRRILCRLLSVTVVSLSDLDRDVILVASDLLPSEVLTMNRARVKGLAMDMGGNTSHTAILARAFGIPAVLGLSRATAEIQDEDLLALNGQTGELLINPSPSELEALEKERLRYSQRQEGLDRIHDLEARTLDGHLVELKANIGIPEEAEGLLHYGAQGVGLFRSEFLFLTHAEEDSKEAADEETQLEAYIRVLKAMGDLPVTIRTVDLGGDKILPGLHTAVEKNPLLGWRAIRFSLSMRDFFKTQLRAILRASVHGRVKIMFPLISGLEELEEALGVLEEAKGECRAKGQPFKEEIEVGVMIEVPSAALCAGILAKKAAFFSIGTNDLVQYTLAVDRGNEKVSYLAQGLHPAIIRLIKMTIDAAHAQGIRAAMCGEMAGEPRTAALLLGLGLDEFSMAASSIPLVKEVIRGLRVKDCQALAAELLQGDSYEANRAILDKWAAAHLPKE
ncbi:MAG: phosphoenolpyruvate--protein phosphotransferase [Treponema sp.]|nr:phosphoenolpyruvate--protein phosphotransferase [Treponema sp.]